MHAVVPISYWCLVLEPSATVTHFPMKYKCRYAIGIENIYMTIDYLHTPGWNAIVWGQEIDCHEICIQNDKAIGIAAL